MIHVLNIKQEQCIIVQRKLTVMQLMELILDTNELLKGLFEE